MLLKNDYGAAVATSIVFALAESNAAWLSATRWHEGLFYVAIFASLAFVMIRLGVVVAIVSIVFVNNLSRINIGPGLSGWYTSYGLATLAVLLAIAVYAFWRSIGTRNISDETA